MDIALDIRSIMAVTDGFSVSGRLPQYPRAVMGERGFPIGATRCDRDRITLQDTIHTSYTEGRTLTAGLGLSATRRRDIEARTASPGVDTRDSARPCFGQLSGLVILLFAILLSIH